MGGGPHIPNASANIYQPSGLGQFDQTYQSLVGQMVPQASNAIGALGATSPAEQAWPYVQQAAQQIYQNPFAQDQLRGSVFASDWLGKNAGNQDTAGANMLSNINWIQNSPLIRSLLNQVPGTIAAGNQVAATGFDPQKALYNQQLQQTTDQTRAALAAQGLGGSPYAAGTEAQALQNFNMGWENNQLQRQLAGLQGLSGANASAVGLGQGVGNIYNALGTGMQQGANLEDQGVSNYLRATSLPYSTYNQQALTALQGLGDQTTMGNQLYQVPQNVLGDISQYMGQGLSAESAAAQSQLQQAQLGLQRQGQQNSVLGGLGQGIGGILGGLGGS